MRLIDNCINALALLTSVCLLIGVLLAREYERRMVNVSFGAGPRTFADWLGVGLIFSAILILIT